MIDFDRSDLCQRLALETMANLPHVAEEAARDELSFQDFFEQLLQAEYRERRERRERCWRGNTIRFRFAMLTMELRWKSRSRVSIVNRRVARKYSRACSGPGSFDDRLVDYAESPQVFFEKWFRAIAETSRHVSAAQRTQR